jgi:glycosyltransferase involved in cell wall biosynthesis
VIIEGMVKKKIILASDVGGIPEILVDGKNGFLFESGNSKSLIDKLELIYQNKYDPIQVRENAFKTIKEKFDIKESSKMYYNFYKKYFKTNTDATFKNNN